MRIATYIGLVVRRVWAKKGILFGSLLGATLVIALLVVVPLYEASVQAVDLKFSIDNALADETDVTAFSTLSEYTAAAADSNRAVVVDAQQEWLQPWYPTTEERTQTREFAVIPSGPDAAVDYLELAADWRELVCAVIVTGTGLGEEPPGFWVSPIPRSCRPLRTRGRHRRRCRCASSPRPISNRCCPSRTVPTRTTAMCRHGRIHRSRS
jgi:hypothetical protein